MKELLYYPGFEIKNETWLKFALLYLDHISPIIPYINASEKDYLTPTFLKVKNNSDLISIKRPTPDDLQSLKISLKKSTITNIRELVRTTIYSTGEIKKIIDVYYIKENTMQDSKITVSKIILVKKYRRAYCFQEMFLIFI